MCIAYKATMENISQKRSRQSCNAPNNRSASQLGVDGQGQEVTMKRAII